MDDDKEPFAGEKGRYHPGNTLNELTGRQWLKFTRTWFVCDSKRYHQNKSTELHPARYPEEMVKEFVLFFTKRGQFVLDPFAGSGATLVACMETERSAVGIEISERYAEVARKRVPPSSLSGQRFQIIRGDARQINRAPWWQGIDLPELPFNSQGLPQFDFVMTSPPYWNMLRKSRGGVVSTAQQRAATGLDVYYSDDPADLGNIPDYDQFIEELGKVFDGVYEVLKDMKYMVVVVQNLRTPEGEIKTLAWDLQKRISQRFVFQGEKIWAQNVKKLGIWGYPTTFVPNYHHHYCLIFRKIAAAV